MNSLDSTSDSVLFESNVHTPSTDVCRNNYLINIYDTADHSESKT